MCAFTETGGAWIPRQEDARRLGAFSRHFRPGAPVRKWHYDKGRYTQGRTSHPQSPATRGFFGFRARYTFSRNSKIYVNPEPRNALVSRDSAVLQFFVEEMTEISTENVKRITVWLKPELLSRMDGWLETANCKNRSEFISKALRFYMGYLATDDVSSYVCESVSQNIRGMLTENTNRLSKLMFKWSVELNMMMHIVAAHFKDDVSDLRALRGYSADEVKRTYGNISFDTALDIQRGNSED